MHPKTPASRHVPSRGALRGSARTWSIVVFLFGAVMAGVVHGQARPLVLGVVPQFPAPVLAARWQPLIEYLEDRLEMRIDLEFASSIPDFEAEFLDATYDLVFLNPYHAVMAYEAHGYEPFVSDGSRLLTGILVVAADSEYDDVRDLDGATIAFPAPNAFGASLYMRALLAEDEGVSFDAEYVGTHSNGYRFVATGRADAAGGVMNTLRAENESLRAELRVLYETPGVTPHPLAVHPRVAPEVSEAITTALIELASTPEGQEILAAVQLAEPIRVTFDEHYAELQRLGLAAFVVNSEAP